MELTSLEPRRKGLTQLYLDGEPGPKLDTEVVLLARLQPGDILSEEELQELVERSDARRAQEKALYLLEHRSHSKRELTEKIARTAASREAAVRAIFSVSSRLLWLRCSSRYSAFSWARRASERSTSS